MKKLVDETIELITPCFCSGANQAKAEIRASSIRGELRWWFRTLGGTNEQEKKVFGSISGGTEDEGASSAVVVRVSDMRSQPGEDGALTENQLFFTKNRKNAMIPAGRTFRLQILLRKETPDSRLMRAIELLLYFGAIGLRSNRGSGAMQRITYPSKAEIMVIGDELKKDDFLFFYRSVQSSALDALSSLENALKEFRAAYSLKPDAPNALGFVKGKSRHASCLRVRPVKLSENSFLPVLIYTERVKADKIESLSDKLTAYFQ